MEVYPYFELMSNNIDDTGIGRIKREDAPQGASCFTLKKHPGMLNCFRDLAGFKALDAYEYSLWGAVDQGPYALKVWQEPARIYPCYLLPYAAFFLGQTAPGYRPSRDGLLAAYLADFRHFYCSIFEGL